jgi:hypothetical protein
VSERNYSLISGNILFSKKMKDRKVKQVLFGCVPVGGGGDKERMKKCDYGGCNLYSCTKIKQ